MFIAINSLNTALLRSAMFLWFKSAIKMLLIRSKPQDFGDLCLRAHEMGESLDVSAAARVAGSLTIRISNLGLAPQALCLRLLRG